jgi:hypothetical protein
MELKPKRGRPRTNFRPPILSDEQVAAIKGIATEDYAAQQQVRKDFLEQDRLRKKADRERARVEKQVESVESYQQLWAMNRTMLSHDALSAGNRRIGGKTRTRL